MNSKFVKSYFLYVLRWIIAAIPGAMLIDMVNSILNLNIYITMIFTQAFLGLIVFWVDRYIIKGSYNNENN